MPENRYECSKCGKVLEENMCPCPACGCNKKHVHVFVEDSIKIRDGIKGKVRGETGKVKRKFVSRNKLSKKGKEAREQLDIDIENDRKFHHVEEMNEKGEWVTVHHEDETLKKKR